MSTSGAQGNFLQTILQRMIPDHETRQRALSRSVFISADNAHGVHPNFPDRFDKEHLPLLNKGPVIKFNANQRYATNSLTSTFFRVMCNKADSPVQEFVMRNDLACGSTIGPLTSAEIGVPTVDVGVPSFAMHSVRETVGAKDAHYFFKVCKTYFSCSPDDSTWQVFSS
jgi:aspartyl aminopeptidase